MSKLKSLPPFLLCTLILTWNCSLRAEIDTALRGIEAFRFERDLHIDSAEERDVVGEFPVPLLQEYGFLNYSRWRVRSGPIGLSVYEMADTQAAFGLFSHWRSETGPETESAGTGGDSLLRGDSIAFWRGHYFLVAQGREDRQAELKALSVTLRESIQERNLHPTSVFQLPEEGLRPETIRFYLGPTALSQNRAVPEFLIHQLGFEDEAEVAFALYGSDQEALLLAAYPTRHLALVYAARVRDAIESHFGSSVYLKLSGSLLGMYLGDEEGANQVLGDLHYSASIEWVHEKDPPLPDLEKKRKEARGLLGIVSDSMVLTGAFIVTVLSVGLLLGLVRVLLIRRFPILEVRDDSVYLDLSG